jgi:hypothetical protein
MRHNVNLAVSTKNRGNPSNALFGASEATKYIESIGALPRQLPRGVISGHELILHTSLCKQDMSRYTPKYAKALFKS